MSFAPASKRDEILGRHQHVRIVADDALPGFALLHVARHNRLVAAKIRRGTFQGIQSQIRSTTMFIGTVTVEAGFRKD